MQLARLCFNINGVDRFVTCDPEKDTLAEVPSPHGPHRSEGGLRHRRVRRLLRHP